MKIGVTIAKSKTQLFINQAYVNYVTNAGFEPIMITPQNNADKIADICDGLLLPGGIDLDPIFYNDDNLDSHAVDPERDDFERKVLCAFINKQKPVFGICRGFQLIVREFISDHEDEQNFENLTYYQNINNHSLSNTRSISRNVRSHSVNSNSLALYGKENDGLFSKMFVNSMHHQALLTKNGAAFNYMIGDDSLRVISYTPFGIESLKGFGYVVEGVDIVWNGSKVRSVQWHPEELNDIDLLIEFFKGKKKGLKEQQLQANVSI